jgi:cyanophycinase-like exopeptidase
MKETHMKYGIGIDVNTAMVFDMENFPEKYEVIGDGIVEVKVNLS